MSRFSQLRGGSVVAVLGLASLASSATVRSQVPPFTDVAMNVIVRGPTTASKTSKSLVAIVVNEGTSTQTVCDTNISWVVEVNGVTAGSVSANPDCATLTPGASARFKATWTYGTGALATGDTVAYTATVIVPDDVTSANNTDTELRIAK